ncbi:MAG: hypothetical protein QF732_02920 [Nitrospinaceae bacterium]|nr:hypothetical protein [Nitrospinaceae bacterium]
MPNLGRPGASLGQLGANVGPTWANLGPAWANLGPTPATYSVGDRFLFARTNLAEVGIVTNPVGASLGQPGANLGQLGANLSTLGREAGQDSIAGRRVPRCATLRVRPGAADPSNTGGVGHPVGRSQDTFHSQLLSDPESVFFCESGRIRTTKECQPG